MEGKILESVLGEFEKIAQIPRPSKHERKVSDYLCARLNDLGLKVEQDSNFNIIADLDASPGFENVPRTILQAHMDMVCVAEPNVKFNPLEDPIKLERSEKFLTAQGTSLGADDGIGIAIILHILKTIKNHGAIRVIFTTDEEVGMTGANNLDEKFVADADFMINCDSETFDEVIVSSAGSVNLDFSKRVEKIPPACENFFEVKIDGLLGGHSGEKIHENRANAIRLLAFTMISMKRKAVELDKILNISEFNGGEARNSIPSKASAIISTQLTLDELETLTKELNARFLAMYDIDSGIKLHVREVDSAGRKIFKSEDATSLIRLITIIHVGVYAMVSYEKDVEQIVETSANLGLVSTHEDSIAVNYFPRSSVDGKLDSFYQLAEDVADLTEFEVLIMNRSPAWQKNPNSKLATLACDIFKSQNDQTMKIKSIHAGLECGYFAMKNPKLNIISLGTTNEAIHSPQEKLHLDTIVPQVNLISTLLERIAGGSI